MFRLSLYKRVNIIIFVSLYIFIFLEYLFINNIYQKDTVIHILEIELFMIYLYALIISIYKSGYISIFSLFLFFSYLFNYTRVFLDLFTEYDLSKSDLFHHVKLKQLTEIELLYLLIFFLIASTLAFILFYKKNKLLLSRKKEYMKFGKIIILSVTIPLIYINIQTFKFILIHGYLSVFNGEIESSSYYTLGIILTRIAYFGFFIFLSGLPNKNNFNKIVLLFLIIAFFDALKGQRGPFLLISIYSIWYYHNIYNIKFNIKKGILIIFGVLAFSQLIVYYRSEKELFDIWEIPYEFMRLNGISLIIPAYMIEYKDSFINDDIPYLFAPIYDYFYRIFIDNDVFYQGRTKELLNVSNYLSIQLIYFINPEGYYVGFATGSSYLAEFYDFGGLFLGSLSLFILVSLIMFFEKKLFKYRLILFLSPIIVTKFIYMPRDSFFKIINDIPLLTVIYLTLYLIIYLGKGKN